MYVRGEFFSHSRELVEYESRAASEEKYVDEVRDERRRRRRVLAMRSSLSHVFFLVQVVVLKKVLSDGSIVWVVARGLHAVFLSGLRF